MFGTWTNLPDVPKDGEPKATPPEATPIILPQPLKLKPARVTYRDDDSLIVKHIRSTFRSSNLQHLRLEDFRKLNISSTDYLPLEDVLSRERIPPKSWMTVLPNPKDLPDEATALAHEALLSNGTRRPGYRKFLDFSKELQADLRTVYRFLRRDPAPQGEQNLRVLQFRKFWLALHNVGRFWDDSLDNVVQTAGNTIDKDASTFSASTAVKGGIVGREVLPGTGSNSDMIAPGNNNLDNNNNSIEPDAKPIMENPISNLIYTGRRTSTGSQMDTILSLNLAEAFLEPLMYAFGCHFDQTSRGAHDLYLVKTITSVHNTKLIYSKPKDPLLARKGILEGPIAVIHAHASVAFGPGTNGDVDQFIRDLKAILLCAQQRSREHELPFCPGAGDWWGLSSGKWGHTTTNGTGGLPGEAIGQPLTDLDLFPGSSLFSTTSVASAPSVPLFAQSQSRGLFSANNIENGDVLVSDAATFNSAQPDPSENLVKVYPLMGEELTSRLVESTLAAPSLVANSLQDDDHSLTDTISTSEISSEQAKDGNFDISKKRSFEAFATPSNTLHSTDGGIPNMMEMDSEFVNPLWDPTSHNGTEPAETLTNEIRKNIDSFTPLPDKLNTQTAKNDWYKLMLEHVRRGTVSEHRARKAFTERANQPARELFPETFKKPRRIGVSSTASQDEVYLISVLNHHIAFVHCTMDHKLMEWLSPNPRERARVTSLKKDTSSWWGIPVRRSRWYNLFDEQDRVEALRATWAIFGRMMADPESDLKAAMAARQQKYGTTTSAS